MMMGNAIIFPSIEETLVALLSEISDGEIIIALIYTLLRTLSASTISFFIALTMAFLAYRYKTVKEFIKPYLNVLKTIPTVALIVIALLLIGREGSVMVAIFLLAFPLFYNGILFALENIDDDLLRMTKTYDVSYIFKIKRIFLPLITDDIISTAKSALSLAFKVAVMSELLVQVHIGLGHELYFYRINILTPEVFALTLIMIVVSILFDKVLDILASRLSSL